MGRKVGLTHAQVVAAAAAVADKHGLAEVSLASVAAAAAGEPDPVASLRAIGRAYRAFAHAHPGLYAALLPVPLAETDPEGAARAAEPVQVVVAVLADLGITPDRHIDLIRTLRAVLHGFVDLELGHGFGLTDPVDASFETALDLVIRALTSPPVSGGHAVAGGDRGGAIP